MFFLVVEPSGQKPDPSCLKHIINTETSKLPIHVTQEGTLHSSTIPLYPPVPPLNPKPFPSFKPGSPWQEQLRDVEQIQACFAFLRLGVDRYSKCRTRALPWKARHGGYLMPRTPKPYLTAFKPFLNRVRWVLPCLRTGLIQFFSS